MQINYWNFIYLETCNKMSQHQNELHDNSNKFWILKILHNKKINLNIIKIIMLTFLINKNKKTMISIMNRIKEVSS